jgi:hypothetical protein
MFRLKFDVPLSILSSMHLGEAPSWGAFTFNYKNKTIYVPSFLNNVARYKPNRFWDWLIYRHPYDSYIQMRYDHIVKEQLDKTFIQPK